MNCDICGREIPGQPFKVKVEGAKMLVCGRCRSLGKPYEDEALPIRLRPRSASLPRPMKRKAPELPRGMEELDIAEDYAQKVRQQRMKLGLSQDDLAKRVKEKLSVIQKIETGKVAPNTKLCKELEHELRIKLLVPRKETAEIPTGPAPTELTLGDIIRIKDKSKSIEQD